MKFNKLLVLVVLALITTEVHAFRRCLMDPPDWKYFFSGFAMGIKGSRSAKTDCLSTVNEIILTLDAIYNAIKNIRNNFLEPINQLGYLVITLGNVNVAC